MNWLVAIFEAIKAGFTFGTKALPSEKIQEERFEIRKERITLEEKDRILKDAYMFLDLRPRLLPVDYVNWKFDSMESDDIIDLLTILEKKYAVRIRKANKTSKFKL